MTLRVTKRESVLRAVAEFDRLGRSSFLRKYRYGEARSYFLVVEGRRYDSKAICGVAHGYENPGEGNLPPEDFSGGRATVVELLERLGFEVEHGDEPKGHLVKRLEAEPLRKLTGPPEHWLTTFHTGFWGLTEDNRRLWSELSEDDLFVLHATAPEYVSIPGLSGGVVGVAVLERTSEKKSLEWLEEIRSEENGWPLLLHFKEVWWFGDTDAITNESIRDRIVKGNDDLAQDCRSLLENRVSFGEMREKGDFQIPAQGSLRRLRNENRDKLVTLLEPRLTRRMSSRVTPGSSRFGEIDPEDDSLEGLRRHSWGAKEIDPEQTDDEAVEREQKLVTYVRNAQAQEKADKGHRELRRIVSQHLIDLGLRPIESRIDVYAQSGDRAIIFELKTVHTKNFRAQTRTAVGQVFEYGYFEVPTSEDGTRPTVTKAIVYSRQPPTEIAGFLDSIGIQTFWKTAEDVISGTSSALAILATIAEASS